MRFEIIRTDINKIVVKPMEFDSAERAAGEYICLLTLAGVLKSADDYTHDGGDRYTLKNGWKIEVRPAQ